MLTDTTVREINRQIQREVSSLSSICIADEDKPAILERIAALTKILQPQPTREELIAELAAAIVEIQKDSAPSPADNLVDVLNGIFRR